MPAPCILESASRKATPMDLALVQSSWNYLELVSIHVWAGSLAPRPSTTHPPGWPVDFIWPPVRPPPAHLKWAGQDFERFRMMWSGSAYAWKRRMPNHVVCSGSDKALGKARNIYEVVCNVLEDIQQRSVNSDLKWIEHHCWEQPQRIQSNIKVKAIHNCRTTPFCMASTPAHHPASTTPVQI